MALHPYRSRSAVDKVSAGPKCIPIAVHPFRASRLPHAAVALLIQFLVSLTYSYSVFRQPLASLHGWSKAQTVAPYQCMLLMVSIGSVVGGIWQDRKGPRIVASVGGGVIAFGCFLAATVGNNLQALVLTFGIVVGFGVGLVYVTPIANLVRWFPDKRGMVVGFAVMGSGFSALFWAPLLENLIGSDLSRFHRTIPQAFVVMGAIFLTLIVGLAQTYRVPPSGWIPPGWIMVQERHENRDFKTMEMLQHRQFYTLYLLFILGTAVGQTTIGNAAPLLREQSTSELSLSIGLALGVLGLCNAAGRLAWGSISDFLDRRFVVAIMGVVSIIACLLFLREPGAFGSLLFGLCLAVFSYAGFLALMPAFIADYFGTANVGANYGILFTAWGISGFLAPGYFERVLDKARESGTLSLGYGNVYAILAAISTIAVGLVALLKPTGPAETRK